MLITEAKDCYVHVRASCLSAPVSRALNQGALNIKTRRDHELVAESELISGTEPNYRIIWYG